MRRLISLLRTSGVFVVLVALYAAVRFWAVLDRSPARFPDSLGYQTVRFFGVNERLWAIPFLYSLVHGDPQRVVQQIVIGIVAWAYLAWILSTLSIIRVPIAMAVLLVGLTPQVIRYDLAMLSESLGISLAVFAVAATIHMQRNKSRTLRVAWFVSIVLVGFTRPMHLVLIFLLAGYYVGTYLLSGRRRRKAAAITFGILSVWAVMQLRGNQSESTLNFYTVLQRRICADTQQHAWFVAHGMPDVSGLCDARGYAYAFEMKNTVGEILQLPQGQQPLKSMVVGDVEMATWVRHHGWSTYTQFVISHPHVVFSVLRHHVSDTLDPPSQRFLPTDSRTLLPHQVLNPWWLWATVAVLGLGVTLFTHRDRGLIRTLGACTALVFIVYVGSLLASAVEPERHAATSAVMLRVLTLSFLAAATRTKGPRALDESSDALSASSSRGTSRT